MQCHNPLYECRTTHPALEVPGWNLNPTDPCHNYQITYRKKKYIVCVCVLVCMHECMCSSKNGWKVKEEEEERAAE